MSGSSSPPRPPSQWGAPAAPHAPRLRPWARRSIVALLAIGGLLAATACDTNSTTTLHATTSTPQQVHGALYVFATNQGPTGPAGTDVYALDLSAGKLLWHSPRSGTEAGAAIGGGTLYLGTAQAGSALPQGALETLNASTGMSGWQKMQSPGIYVPLAASSDAVFTDAFTFVNSQGPPRESVQALRASDGAPLWSFAVGQPGAAATSPTATLGDGALYLVTASEATATFKALPTYTLLALDTGTGKPLWRLALQSSLPVFTAPVLSNGVLYLSEQYFPGAGPGSPPSSFILAVRVRDGAVLWRSTPLGASGSVVVSGGMVYYSYGLMDGPGGGIVALRAADGSSSWQATTQSGGPVPLAAGDGVLYTAEQSKSATAVVLKLHAYDASTGRTIFERPFPSLPIQPDLGPGSPLQVVAGSIYLVVTGVSAQTGTLATPPQPVSIVLALNASDGSLKWGRTLLGAAGPSYFVVP